MVAAALAAGNHHQVTRRCRVEKAEQRPGQQQCQWHNPQVGAHEERGLSHSIHRESPWASPAEWSETSRALRAHQPVDRKSTRLNSSHVRISYAVLCLKKKNIN